MQYRFIMQWSCMFKIFSLEKTPVIFLSWRGPFQFFSFLEKGLRKFFFSISSGPQIVNGRPLT